MAKKTAKKTPKTVYTVAEAAHSLHVSTNAVRKAIKKGRLAANKGKYEVKRLIKRTLTGYLISAKDLDAYRVSDRHQEAGKKTD